MIKRFSAYCDHHDPIDEDPAGDMVLIEDLAPLIEALVTKARTPAEHDAAVEALRTLLRNDE